MPSTHRTYDKDFRQEAVNLLLGSGRPLKRVAAELGALLLLDLTAPHRSHKAIQALA